MKNKGIQKVRSGGQKSPNLTCTRFFIRNMFIRNLHVESSKIKKLLLLHSISISKKRQFYFYSRCIFTADDS